MMGTRSPQDKLFAADQIYLDFVGRDTVYGYLAQNRQHLFRDEDFAALYCRDNGRTSVPPSLAISILFLRAYERVSFVEAIERTKYDLRWKVALGLEMEEVPMQKSSLQEFEAKLVLHEMEEPLLKKSIAEARRAGYLPNRKIRVALDTTPILGKGAVKDTYNLLAEGIVQLAKRLAEAGGEEVTAWAERQGLSGYFGSSLKGEAAIDWDDKAQKEQLLRAMVQDGRRLLSGAEKAEEQYPEQAEGIEAAAALLKRLITQDVEEKPEGGCQVKEGTEKDRGGECARSGDAAWAQERQQAVQRAQGGGGVGDGEPVDQWGGGAGGQCGGPGEGAGTGEAERAGDGGGGGRDGGRLRLWRGTDTASLRGGRTPFDGQGAGQPERRLFSQERV
jgi:hypothetical protein